MEIYLDNSATTRCLPEVTEAMCRVMEQDYGNPSSMHQKGVEAENYLKEAQGVIAKTLKVQPKEIVFTSGGTESNNMAVIGGVLANKRAGNRVITTSIEHASVSGPVKLLEELGFEVVYLPVDGEGIVSLEAFKEAMTEDTILVSMMVVNNEIGTVQPVEETVRIAKAVNPNVVFHVDAVQAYTKYEIYPSRTGIDLLSASAHKFHGPKGVGFLYMKDKVKVKPLLLGGGQQLGRRSGTDNVPGIVGLAVAAKEGYKDFAGKNAHQRECRAMLIEGLQSIERVRINGGTGEHAAPHIVSASFPGIRSEVLLHALEERGIYISAGSACSSNKAGKTAAGSATLTAIGLRPEEMESTVRFSFSSQTTFGEITQTIDALRGLVPQLRRFSRK